MRVRIIGTCFGRTSTEQKVRLAIGSWAGHLRQVTVQVQDPDVQDGPRQTACSILASPSAPGEPAFHAAGADLDAVLRTAVRQLKRRLRDRTRA